MFSDAADLTRVPYDRTQEYPQAPVKVQNTSLKNLADL